MKDKFIFTFKNTIKGVASDVESFNSLKLPFYDFYHDQEKLNYRTKPSSASYLKEIVLKSKNNIDISDLFLGIPSHSYFLKKNIYEDLISKFNLPPHVIEEVKYKVGSLYYDDGFILTFTEDASLYIDFSKSEWKGITLNMKTFENEIVQETVYINDKSELFNIMKGQSNYSFSVVPKNISLLKEKNNYDFLPFIVLTDQLVASFKVKNHFISKSTTNCIFEPCLF